MHTGARASLSCDTEPVGWWLLARPRWVRAALSGALFGVFIGLYFGLQHGWADGLIAGVVGGALFGPIMTVISGSAQGSVLAAAGLAEPDDLEAAVRAARRGPGVGDNPEARRGAQRMLRYQLDLLERQRRPSLIIFGLAPIAFGVAAITGRSWWFLILTVGWAAIAVRQLTAPRRLRHRLRAFDADTDADYRYRC